MSNIQSNVNLVHYDSGISVNGGTRRLANEASFSSGALSLTTTPEVVPTGDIITPRTVVLKNFEGDDALVSIDGGATFPLRLSPDGEGLSLRLDFESHREVSTFVCQADTSGSLAGDHLEIYDRNGEVWPWFSIIDPSIAEVSRIVTVADIAGSLDAKYFVIYDSAGSVGVWFDVDNSGTLIPAGASACARAIEVTGVTTGMTAPQVATVLAAALEADAQFTATSSTSTVTVTDVVAGGRTDLTAGDSGFTVSVTTQGYTGTTSTPPVVTTERLIQVDIVINASAALVAVALASALEADAEFIAEVPTTSSAVITDQYTGTRSPATAGDTGWASVTAGGQGSVFYDVEVKSTGTSKLAFGVAPN